MRNEENQMGVALGVVVAFALNIFWGGYVAATLWGWFVVPLGVMAITYWHAVGLTCVVAAFARVKNDDSIKEPESLGEGVAKSVFMAVIIPAILLATGWFAHNHMS
ncbi:hypothetical protein [Pseudomonas sp. 4810-S13]|uniref:hypothetical protein n=1 Tax=Pseudomonas sp. 4810-S13 TaxID=3120822 RepID=UPI0031B6A77B